MTLEWTLGGFAAAAAVLIASLLRARRPYVPGKPPLVPPGAVQFLALFVMILMAGHLVSLMTGQPFTPRWMGR